MSLVIEKSQLIRAFSVFILLLISSYYALFFSGYSSARFLQVVVMLMAYSWLFLWAGRDWFIFPAKVAILFSLVYGLNFISLYTSGEDWTGYSLRDLLSFFAFIPFAYIVYENFSRRYWLYLALLLGVAAMPWLGG